MTLKEIMNIIECVFTVLCALFALYFKYSSHASTKTKKIQSVVVDLMSLVIGYMNEVEMKYDGQAGKGREKFNEVVNKLYTYVPDKMHKIITKDMIEDLVQSTFDDIQDFIKTQNHD